MTDRDQEIQWLTTHLTRGERQLLTRSGHVRRNDRTSICIRSRTSPLSLHPIDNIATVTQTRDRSGLEGGRDGPPIINFNVVLVTRDADFDTIGDLDVVRY